MRVGKELSSVPRNELLVCGIIPWKQLFFAPWFLLLEAINMLFRKLILFVGVTGVLVFAASWLHKVPMPGL